MSNQVYLNDTTKIFKKVEVAGCYMAGDLDDIAVNTATVVPFSNTDYSFTGIITLNGGTIVIAKSGLYSIMVNVACQGTVSANGVIFALETTLTSAQVGSPFPLQRTLSQGSTTSAIQRTTVISQTFTLSCNKGDVITCKVTNYGNTTDAAGTMSILGNAVNYPTRAIVQYLS